MRCGSTLGTPTSERWPGIERYPFMQQLKDCYPGQPLALTVRTLDAVGLDLLGVRTSLALQIVLFVC